MVHAQPKHHVRVVGPREDVEAVYSHFKKHGPKVRLVAQADTEGRRSLLLETDSASGVMSWCSLAKLSCTLLQAKDRS